MNKLIQISERARGVYDHAIAGYYVSEPTDRVHHEEEAHAELKHLAALMGFDLVAKRPALVVAE